MRSFTANFYLNLFYFLFCLALPFAFAACNDDDGDGFDFRTGDIVDSETGESITGSGSSKSFTLDIITEASGRGSVSFKLPEKTNKFSVTVEAEGTDVKIDSVSNDRGSEWISPKGAQISLAREFSPLVKTASIPSRASDFPVVDYATYTVTATADIPGTALKITINAKQDVSLEAGTLPVNVFFVGEATQGSNIASTVNSSLVMVSTLLREQAGILPQFSKFNINGPSTLPNPILGDPFYLESIASSSGPVINVFLGGDIVDDVGGIDEGSYGIPSDIPGPPNPSTRSAIAISLFAAGGPDGIFSEEERRVLAETILHQLGHYMGLFHPVDFEGQVVVASDPLTDTPVHDTLRECLDDSGLNRNIMFPFAVLVDDDPTETVPRNFFTVQQRAVMNRYIAVD